MAEEKEGKKPKAKAKAKAKAPAGRPDVLIVIGAKSKIEVPSGVQVWSLEGEEVTEKGDRRAVAKLTAQDLYALGWVRRKY
jgi:hypothetical protein